jgi:hypothetical protein
MLWLGQAVKKSANGLSLEIPTGGAAVPSKVQNHNLFC